MEYGRRQELKSEPIKERTTMMMRSVREILAEQGQAHLLDAANFVPASEAPTMPPRPMPGAATSAGAAQKGGVQRPPHMKGVINPAKPRTPDHAVLSQLRTPAAETAPAEKSRSLLSRLIGR